MPKDIIALDESEQKVLVEKNEEVKKKIQERRKSPRSKTKPAESKPEPKSKKSRKKHAWNNFEKLRGLVYISHIPHGFYEEEMRDYFSQFGKVTNVRVCRSNKTGRSKGYGYVEFYNRDVAKIAAETMNNYLMFKRRIVAEFVPFEKRLPFLFLKKQPAIPTMVLKRQRQMRAKHTIPTEVHNERLQKRLTRLSSKLNKLKQLGINTDFTPVDIADAELMNRFVQKTKKSSPIKKKTQNSPKNSANSPKVKRSSPKLKPETTSKTLLSKSVGSVKALLDKSGKISTPKVIRPLKVDKSTETKAVRKQKTAKRVIQKKKVTAKSLDSETVKRIARELVRKRGPSLLSFPKPTKIKKEKIKKE